MSEVPLYGSGGLDLAKALDRNLTLQSSPRSFFVLRDGNPLKILSLLTTLEATQGQNLSQSPTDATSGRQHLNGTLTEETIYLPLGCLQGGTGHQTVAMFVVKMLVWGLGGGG